MAFRKLGGAVFIGVILAVVTLNVDSLKLSSDPNLTVKTAPRVLDGAEDPPKQTKTRHIQHDDPARHLRQQGSEVKSILVRNLRDVHPQTVPPAPGTVAPFPFDPELLAAFISLNMDKIELFMPLFYNLKTYFDFSWFANSAVQTIANAAAKALLQDFPPVLGSAVVNGTIDALIAEVQKVNLTGVNMSDSGAIVQSIVTRLSYSNILAKYYELVRNTKFPQFSPLKFKLETVLLNFSLVTLPNFLRDPLVEEIGKIVQQEFMKVNLNDVNTSTDVSALRSVALQINWTRLLTDLDMKLRPRYPLTADVLALVKRELLSVSLAGLEANSTITTVLQAVVLQLHWLDIMKWFYVNFGHYTPVAWDNLLAREFLSANLTGVVISQLGPVIEAIGALNSPVFDPKKTSQTIKNLLADVNMGEILAYFKTLSDVTGTNQATSSVSEKCKALASLFSTNPQVMANQEHLSQMGKSGEINTEDIYFISYKVLQLERKILKLSEMENQIEELRQQLSSLKKKSTC